ncbi:unnamed protein product [Rotaria sp. Silwood1]|nr:unnamed protein product [Rotaria sp. Silwood1]CAF1621708.1 unnamed protein product [Rotaria sp. Silwood1]CAF3795990.1 unnamed protein product [Rotaria sp. Silwood1]CAF4885541.1 unnamed protein product [Rotaria sp. Silwood1]CAF4898409.1 unnamed protein product [Rotaria sp. Silwood1]
MVKNLVEQCVDCNFSCFNNNLSDFNRHLSYFHRNVSHFDRLINTFISPIQLAAKLGRHEELLLLYEHRNSPTKLQLEKRWTFYINHYDRLHREGNEILFDYTVSRLLYTRITTEHTKIVFDNLIPALRDIDNASHRGRSLSDGSRPEIFLQVRIYTLVRTIIDKKINKDDHMIEIIEKELLHNLETYYFIIGILLIPVNITKPMMNQSFSRIKSSQSLLMKYYRKIAKNLISKIKQLEINDEYTIPTGWKEHAVCVSFRLQKNIYQEPNAIAFACLECLAFDATKEHRFTITGKEITNVVGPLRLSVLQIVLLIPQTRNPSPLIVENIYYFIHRTFQEYLSARYMVRMLESFDSNDQKKEVVQFITYEKYNHRIQHTFRLFFELKRSPSCIEQFWSTIDREPRDLVGLRHCSRIAHWFPNGTCSFSAEDQNEIDQRVNKSVLTWISNKDRLPNDIANTYIFESFAGLTGHQCWIDAWKEDLFIEDPSKRRYFFS